jgi:two-component system nitrate/nitrite response regulator NarL
MSRSATRLRTMVVDDSPDTLAAISSYLQELPAIDVVATASDGREAVEKFELLEPDLVLMDFQMPKMNGFEAMSHIKSLKSSTKVIMFTVHDSASLRVAVMSKGADGFLGKSHFYRLFPTEMERLFPGLLTDTL